MKLKTSLFVVSFVIVNISGCAMKFAPPTEMLREKPEISLVQQAITQAQPSRRSAIKMAMRSGRAVAVKSMNSDGEILLKLPSAEFKQELDAAYIHPFKFQQTPAGSQHYYNFTPISNLLIQPKNLSRIGFAHTTGNESG
ncbi:MAG: hypothetical protein Q8O31_08740 [Rhodocyclaceae bacterium]|nr:hypothetical protein [Rhodocyclaceae bacterium]